MVTRSAAFLAVLGLLLAACTGDTSADTTVPATPVDRLAIIDDTGNILTMNPDGSDAVAISDDGGPSVAYFQPTWSPSSEQLVWGRASQDEGFSSGVGDPQGEEAEAISMPDNPFYFYWSPDGRWVGALHNAAEGNLDLELVDTESHASSVAANGAPFYFSWDQTGSQMVAHIGDTGFQLITVDGELTDLGETGPVYQAPQWTGAGVFHIRGADLILLQPDGPEEVVATVSGPSTFVSNREGTRVALLSVASGGVPAGLEAVAAIPLGRVVVLDVGSGEVETVSDKEAIGYFWSPNGESLLIFEPASELGTLELKVWHEGATRDLATYQPPGSFFRDVLPFFTQYAQSISLWSPDSSSIAFTGIVDGTPGIWVQGVAGGAPEFVADGFWVVWSTR